MVNKMRTIIEGFPFEWQIDIVNRLNITPVYWISNNIRDRYKFPDGCIFHSAESLINWDVPEDVVKKLGFDLSDVKYIKDSTIFDDSGEIDKISRIIRIRQELYGKKFASNEGLLRRAIYKQISFWYAVINKTNAEAVLFEATPHLVNDYTLYYVAKKLGIRTIIFNRVGDPLRFFIAESLDNIVPDLCINKKALAGAVQPIRKKPEYAISGPSAIKRNSIGLKKIIKNRNKLFMLATYNPLWLILKNKVYKIPYRYLYHKNMIKKIPKKKFVYFPLHESPEDTTYPMGGNFEDQIYALEYLAELLPPDVFIVVKEHPNQRYWRGRYLSFYADIISIRNVFLIDQNIDTFSIIDNCMLVATITGQSGWEALTNNKRVIYFGQAWYKGAPGTIYIDEFKDKSTHDRDVFMEDKSKLDLQPWYQQFHERTIPGYVNNICSGGVSVDPDLISSHINSYLSND
jgi:hypothetical protein